MILERVRAACEGPILLLKGPEVAARYPHGARTFGDVDLLVPDAQRTQRELIAAGFAEEDDPEGIWVGIHHLARLRWQGLELAVEVHSEPKWPDGLTPPPSAELFEAAVPASVGVDGILAPAPSHHALVLAAHAWAHQSIGRARDLVDVGALRSEADEAMLRALARAWRIPRVWNTMSSSLDAVLCGQRTWPLRLWAGHVPELRPQTVLETHVERLVSPFWAYPPAIATRHAGANLARTVRPAADEGWREKLQRSHAALRRSFRSAKEHRQLLGESANRGRGRHRRTRADID